MMHDSRWKPPRNPPRFAANVPIWGRSRNLDIPFQNLKLTFRGCQKQWMRGSQIPCRSRLLKNSEFQNLKNSVFAETQRCFAILIATFANAFRSRRNVLNKKMLGWNGFLKCLHESWNKKIKKFWPEIMAKWWQKVQKNRARVASNLRGQEETSKKKKP